MIVERLNSIVSEVEVRSPELKTRAEYDAFKSTISGPKGQLTEVMKLMGTVPKEDKPAMGKFINEAKQQIQAIMEATQVRIEDSELLAQLGPSIDPSLPSPDLNRGSIHPIAQVRDVIVDLFHRIGFAVAEGTELETEYYCFDALNIPADHPARDMQDSYFMPGSCEISNVSKFGEERYL